MYNLVTFIGQKILVRKVFEETPGTCFKSGSRVSVHCALLCFLPLGIFFCILLARSYDICSYESADFSNEHHGFKIKLVSGMEKHLRLMENYFSIYVRLNSEGDSFDIQLSQVYSTRFAGQFSDLVSSLLTRNMLILNFTFYKEN